VPEQAAVVKPIVDPNVLAAHAVQTVAPAREYVPIAHLPEQVDTLRPDDEPNVPAAHCVQDDAPASE